MIVRALADKQPSIVEFLQLVNEKTPGGRRCRKQRLHSTCDRAAMHLRKRWHTGLYMA